MVNWNICDSYWTSIGLKPPGPKLQAPNQRPATPTPSPEYENTYDSFTLKNSPTPPPPRPPRPTNLQPNPPHQGANTRENIGTTKALTPNKVPQSPQHLTPKTPLADEPFDDTLDLDLSLFAMGNYQERYSTDHYIGENITSLNRMTFQEFLDEKDSALVLFYKPNSDKTKLSRLEFLTAAAVSQRENRGFAAVDCKQEKALCAAMKIKEMPLYKLYSRGRYVNTFSNYSRAAFLAYAVEASPVIEDSPSPVCSVKSRHVADK